MTTLPPSDPAAAAASAAQGAPTGATPGTSELAQLAPQVPGVPDAATIARLANAFYAGAPSSPLPGPGAALPSAPVFAAEPLYNALPGVPALQVPLSPNLNPGLPPFPFPSSGAAQPSAPVFAVEPLIVQATAAPAPAAVGPVGDKGAPVLPASSSPAFGASPAAAAPYAPGGIPSEADLAALPSSLGGVMSLVPRFEPERGATAAGWPGSVPGSAYAGPSEGFSFFDRGAGSQAGATPFAFQASALDFKALPYQHVTTLGAPAPAISGVRAFDPHVMRRDFPILDQNVNGRPLIWLDNAATTQKPQSVIDRISLFYERDNSNIHRGAHTLAARSTDAYEGARGKVRDFINAPSPESIIFVRGTTEGINLIAKAWGGRNVNKDDEIVITHLEHHANIVPWQQLAAEKGAKLRVAPVDDSGQIILEEFEKLLNPRTRIVSVSQVSNALGTITPVTEMVAMAHRHGAIAVVDGAQSVSHMPVDVQALDADFFVFSGHKMFAPTGIGAVYGRPSILENMPPWQGGGNMIQDVTFEKTVFQGPPDRFEAGTGNIADAVGLGAAIDYLSTIGMSNIAAYEHELLGYATQGLMTVPGLRIIGTAHEKAGVISFVLDECRSEDVGKALDREGIAVRSGHHCAQPILRRFGLESTVRPSLALYNTPEDVDALIGVLQRIQTGRGKRGL
jgi:cysteine desulfurase / selenocysteine lyase